jgi:hypothetical protein
VFATDCRIWNKRRGAALVVPHSSMAEEVASAQAPRLQQQRSMSHLKTALRRVPTAKPARASASIPSPRVALPERRQLVTLLRSLGGRELYTAHILSAGLRLAPTLDDKVVLGQESLLCLERLEALSTIYESLGEGDLLGAVQRRFDGLPSPQTWGELVMARFLLNATAAAQSDVYGRFTSTLRLVGPIAGMSPLGTEHHEVAQATLCDLVRQGRQRAVAAQMDLERWLRTVSLFLEGPAALVAGRGGDGRDTIPDCFRIFAARVRPALSLCGLRLPSEIDPLRDDRSGLAAP